MRVGIGERLASRPPLTAWLLGAAFGTVFDAPRRRTLRSRRTGLVPTGRPTARRVLTAALDAEIGGQRIPVAGRRRRSRTALSRSLPPGGLRRLRRGDGLGRFRLAAGGGTEGVGK